MNGRKAKTLRRIAEQKTKGMPEVSYELGKPPEYAARKNEQGDFIQPLRWYKSSLGIPKKLGYCTRKVHKDMKKLNK